MEDKKIRIVRAVQTSMACPSQWDLWDAEGNYYYGRFRHGDGSLRQYKTEDWPHAPWREDVDQDEPGWGWKANVEYIRTVATFEEGDEWSGYIELPEFAERCGIELAENIYYNHYGEHLRDELIKEGLTFLLEKEDDG